jgi:YihY family inner membrane protein
MNPVERILRRLDRFQRRHGVLGFPFAVVRKFGDDRGGNLTALLTYSAFFALFPALLLLLTGLGFVLAGNPSLQAKVLDSALAEFPILGTQLRQNVQSLRGSGPAVAVGLLWALWGARGLTQAGQHAMAEIWNIPGKARPDFLTRQLRGVALLLVFVVGLTGTTVLTGLGSLGGASSAFRAGNHLASAALNVVLFLLAFRVLTPRQIPTRQLVFGAVVAGLAWQGLLAIGGYLVSHNLRRASEVYGFFAVVLGLLSWLYIGAQVTLYAAEVNVVRARRLWPRSLLQPPLTEPDKRALVHLAKQEERRPEQSVEVTFEPDEDEAEDEAEEQGQVKSSDDAAGARSTPADRPG